MRTSPDVALLRVQSRARPEERTITEAYLTALHVEHELWLDKTLANVIVLNGDLSKKDIVSEYDKVLEQIMSVASEKVTVIGKEKAGNSAGHSEEIESDPPVLKYIKLSEAAWPPLRITEKAAGADLHRCATQSPPT